MPEGQLKLSNISCPFHKYSFSRLCFHYVFQVAYGISSGIINSGLATHPTFTEHPLHPHTHCHIRLTRALLAQPPRDLGHRWEDRGHVRPQTRRLSIEQNCMARVSAKYFSFPPKDINFIICLFDCKSRCICT